jgi:phospholipid/cholesterol/gamma-HCH transport system substrate-binding protein
MNRQMKVGIFVLFGLALCGVAVFLIGDSRKLWEPKVSFRAAFSDVAGLKPGAPVRTGGLDIGTVIAVGHADNAGDPRIYVTMQVTKAEAARVREDSLARVASKGLLGDKMIEITVSDGRAPPQDPAKLLKSEDPKDMFAAMNDLAARAQKVVERIEPLAQQLGDPKFAEDIKGSAEDLHRIMDGIAKNDSVVHKLLFDPEEGRKFSQLMTNVNHVTYNLDGVLSDTKELTSRVKTGPGIAHALVYDGDLSANASGVMAEFHQDMKAVREGNGLAHAVLYGDDKSQHVMANLNAITDDMRVIVSGMRAGKGTVGALLVDPSVYEDLKSAIGNVERNQVLRALVRYSIKADEERPKVHTPPTTAPPAAAK